MKQIFFNASRVAIAICALACAWLPVPATGAEESLDGVFLNAQASARPWVYWFIMDGNLTREGITGSGSMSFVPTTWTTRKPGQ